MRRRCRRRGTRRRGRLLLAGDRSLPSTGEPQLRRPLSLAPGDPLTRTGQQHSAGLCPLAVGCVWRVPNVFPNEVETQFFRPPRCVVKARGQSTPMLPASQSWRLQGPKVSGLTDALTGSRRPRRNLSTASDRHEWPCQHPRHCPAKSHSKGRRPAAHSPRWRTGLPFVCKSPLLECAQSTRRRERLTHLHHLFPRSYFSRANPCTHPKNNTSRLEGHRPSLLLRRAPHRPSQAAAESPLC